MITINPTSASSVGVAQTNADEIALDVAQSETTQAEPQSSADPLAKFALNDLHPVAHSFAQFAPGQGNDAEALLARYTPQNHADTKGTAAPLYQSKEPPGTGQVQQVKAPPPATPGAPIDVSRMEALNKTVQSYKVARSSPVDADDLRETQRKFQAATDALKAGKFKEAEKILGSLGFPLPAPGKDAKLSYNGALTAILLGVPVKAKRGGGWEMAFVKWGAHGNQALNDVNGFAANAIMINRMASAKGGVSNPATEAQATNYMRDFANPAQGKRPTPQQVMQAASEITNGMIGHYSSAGAKNPTYGDNPNQRAYYKDRAGQIHEFESIDAAKKAMKAGNPEIAPRGKIIPIIARSPDEWSDISAPGTRAGRYVGDCESKVYLQTRLLTAAGFTSLGSVDVQRKDGGSGHMFGVFKAPDGTLWVTSNEEFRQVRASDAKKGVTQTDLDDTMREMTAELYHIEPNYKGELDLSDFNIAASATANRSGPNAAIDTIRRSTELNVLGRNEMLIPPPPPAKTKP
jgi:hypothetical protein